MKKTCRKNWTQREVGYLRRRAPHGDYRNIAHHLGRTLCSVKCKANKLGLVTKRQLTDEQKKYVRANYGKKTALQIAQHIGRTKHCVHQLAIRLGLSKRRPPLCRAFDRKLRRLHQQGLTDPAVAEKLGCERHTVSDHRKKMGLPANTFSQWRRRRVGKKTREQLHKAGLTTLAAVRAKSFRDRARAAGWPEDLRPRAVQILNVLWDRGPMTRRELAEAIGMPWKGSRKSLVSNDAEGSYLAHLIKRGLVVNLGRVRKAGEAGGGRGSSTCVYSLPLWIERNPKEPEHAA